MSTIAENSSDESNLRCTRHHPRFRCAVIALAFLAGACQTPGSSEVALAPDSRQLTSAEIQEQLSGKTAEGKYLRSSQYTKAGTAWTEYYSSDGRSTYRERGNYLFGRWTIADDQICFVYSPPADGTQHCMKMYHDADGLKVVSVTGDNAGKVTSVIQSISDGNSANLPLE